MNIKKVRIGTDIEDVADFEKREIGQFILQLLRRM